MLANNIKIIVVFDGDWHPLKEGIENIWMENRERKLNKAFADFKNVNHDK